MSDGRGGRTKAVATCTIAVLYAVSWALARFKWMLTAALCTGLSNEQGYTVACCHLTSVSLRLVVHFLYYG